MNTDIWVALLGGFIIGAVFMWGIGMLMMINSF